MVIFPGSAFMSVAYTVGKVMEELKAKGTTEHLVGQMTPLTDAFELMGLTEMLERDAGYAVAGNPNVDHIQEENRRFRALETKALAIYRSTITPTLTEDDQGKWLIINTENENFEILPTEADGLARFAELKSDSAVYLMPIGEPEPVVLRNA